MTLDHQQLSHPNVHRAFSQWSEEQTLHLAVMYSNPQRWPTRRELFQDFRKRFDNTPNVRLYVGEIAHGDRPFEVTCKENPLDFQFRTAHELWLKENVLNLIVQRMPEGAKYVGYVDGDVQMSRYDWALEAIHQLQHYGGVQLFHQFADADYRQRPYCVSNGFAYQYSLSITPEVYHQDPATSESVGVKAMEARSKRPNPNNYCGGPKGTAGNPAQEKVWWGATGLGWAFRRSTWDAMGGLFDRAVIGSSDWIMAYGMAGLVDDLDIKGCAPYYQAVKDWQHHATELKADIWYIDNFITHYWHGPKTNRFYRERERILVEHQFDPNRDLRRDWQGLWQLAGNKPRLRDDLRAYFRARNEMDQNLGPGGRLLA